MGSMDDGQGSMCEHPVKFNGLCAVCGAVLIENDYEAADPDSLHILHGSLDIQVSTKVLPSALLA